MSADLRGGQAHMSIAANRDAYGLPNTPVGNAVARMRLGLGFVGNGWQPVIMELWEAGAYASACGRSRALTCRDCANYEGRKRCILHPREEIDHLVAEGEGADLCKHFKEYRKEGGMSEDWCEHNHRTYVTTTWREGMSIEEALETCNYGEYDYHRLVLVRAVDGKGGDDAELR